MSKSTNKAVLVARLVYLLVCELAGIGFAHQAIGPDKVIWGVIGGAVVAGFFIYVDSLMKQFTLRGFSTATFGLLIGLFCAWLLSTVKLTAILEASLGDTLGKMIPFIDVAFNIILFASLGFLGTVLALRSSQNDFAFIIPYIRFREESSRGRPVVVSMDVITDGRLAALVDAGFINRRIVIPSFVVQELQVLAKSPAPTAQRQGERGLSCLEELQSNPANQVTLHDEEGEANGHTNEALTIETCRLLNTRLLTTDDNLTKAARMQNIEVLNLNTLTTALRQKVEIGQKLSLAIVKPGKEDHQGVGFLPDGTMIVVNQAAKKIGATLDVTVISTIQTSAGVMVFAEITGAEAA